LFGLMSAVRLAEAGFSVHLFERHADLMKGASAWSNRLHMGYHYPRDDHTIRQCLRGYSRFKKEFEPAILKNVRNAYFISEQQSLTTPEDFVAVCRRNGLRYQIIDRNGYEPEVRNVSLGILTNEEIYSPDILRILLAERLRSAGAEISLGVAITEINRIAHRGFLLRTGASDNFTFDKVVNCTYANMNELGAPLGHPIRSPQYEYVMGAIIELDWHEPRSITILDGPFFSLLPLGAHRRYLLIHVTQSVIFNDVGTFVPTGWFQRRKPTWTQPEINKWFAELVESCSNFLPALLQARLIDVFQQPRMVLANKETTDERPSIVKEWDGYISVFSGKGDHSLWVADDVLQAVNVT